MSDKALKGNKLTRPRAGPGMSRDPKRSNKRDTRMDSDIAWHESLSPNEALGIYVSGGMKGKPHSTKEGRLSAAKNFLNRAWGQKYDKKKKKKKKEGTEV